MERKLATVLFVDLVGSTQLVASADPEVVRSRLERFFEQISHCIDSHGGVIQRFAGDAVMRAAYGKGYCDALTEDDPGSLCHDHGYRIPARRPAPARD